MTKSIPPRNIVLYADDDVDDLQLVEEAFSNYTQNVEVVTFTDGVKALSYLENLKQFDPKPCLIILDINMPRISGKEVLREIRKTDQFKDTPVVLFSTSSMKQDKEFAEKLNAGFITKPIDLRQMQMITGEFIEHCTDEIKKNIRRETR
jgi:CheY-like chemotaxis protein